MKPRNEWDCEFRYELGPKGETCETEYPTLCSHLEKKHGLVSMRDKKLRRADVANMSQDVFHVQRPSFSKDEFVELMRNYGFTEKWDLELLTARYYRGLSNRDITKEQNFCSPRTTDRRLKALHALLKERGFEQEIWSWTPEKK